jgi:hypothetical protein
MVHATGVIMAGSVRGGTGELGLTFVFEVDGELMPAITVNGKVADDLMALAKAANEAYQFKSPQPDYKGAGRGVSLRRAAPGRPPGSALLSKITRRTWKFGSIGPWHNVVIRVDP